MALPAARRSLFGLAIAALVSAALSVQAEEVTTRHRGLTLNGNLELADGKGLEDGVILITHGLLAHNKMEIISAFQGLFKTRGLSTLAINLSLGISDRHGFFDCGRLQTHRPTDALDEIEAWVGWLKTQGATDIVLMGHSQGGAQTALYAAERKDEAISAVVLVAPGTFSPERAAAAYQQRHGVELAPILDRAQALVRDGRGQSQLDRIGFLSCENATVTAASFVGWYAPSPLRHTPALLARIKARTLVVVAGADAVVSDLAEEVAPMDGKGAVSVKVIEGADHFFLDLFADEAAEAVTSWLSR